MLSSSWVIFHPRGSYFNTVDYFKDNYLYIFYDTQKSSEIVSLLCCTIILNYGAICIHDGLLAGNIWVH